MQAGPISRHALRRHAAIDQVEGTMRHADHLQGPGLPAHFLNTPTAAVARIYVGADLVEIVRWKRGNLHPTYQGMALHDRATGTWTVTTPKGEVLGTTADYRDAEVLLLDRTSRIRSQSTLTWPTTIHAHLADNMLPLCRVCREPRRGPTCDRDELHWKLRAAGTAYGRTATA